MDNYYTTLHLAKFLIENKTACVGTLRENRLKIDKTQFLNVFPRKKGDILILINKDRDITLTIFYDVILVIILSTLEIPKHCYPKKTKFRVQSFGKPTSVARYNNGMGGVDQCNARCVRLRYRQPQHKWWLALYFHLIQLTMSNAFVIYQEFKKKIVVNGRLKTFRTFLYFVADIIDELIDIEAIENPYHNYLKLSGNITSFDFKEREKKPRGRKRKEDIDDMSMMMPTEGPIPKGVRGREKGLNEEQKKLNFEFLNI